MLWLKPRSSSGNFSPKTRKINLKRMQKEEFDLAVIGGGITGAAIARDAAMRGMKVALIEKADFASGTSSKSSNIRAGETSPPGPEPGAFRSFSDPNLLRLERAARNAYRAIRLRPLGKR
jgi:glycine/D-amino acid oxidase-like deaminating enzyme